MKAILLQIFDSVNYSSIISIFQFATSLLLYVVYGIHLLLFLLIHDIHIITYRNDYKCSIEDLFSFLTSNEFRFGFISSFIKIIIKQNLLWKLFSLELKEMNYLNFVFLWTLTNDYQGLLWNPHHFMISQLVWNFWVGKLTCHSGFNCRISTLDKIKKLIISRKSFVFLMIIIKISFWMRRSIINKKDKLFLKEFTCLRTKIREMVCSRSTFCNTKVNQSKCRWYSHQGYGYVSDTLPFNYSDCWCSVQRSTTCSGRPWFKSSFYWTGINDRNCFINISLLSKHRMTVLTQTERFEGNSRSSFSLISIKATIDFSSKNRSICSSIFCVNMAFSFVCFLSFLSQIFSNYMSCSLLMNSKLISQLKVVFFTK